MRNCARYQRRLIADKRIRNSLIGLSAIYPLIVSSLIFFLAACEPAATALPTIPAPSTRLANEPTNQPANSQLPTSNFQPPTSNFQPPTAEPPPTSTPLPTLMLTSTPPPSPTLQRLTDGQCCTQPFWSPDSKQVLFIDKPEAKAPTGIYAVDIDAPGPPKLLTERIAFYTSDLKYAVSIEGAFAVLEQLSDGQKWKIRTGGRSVLISPDRTRVVWSETPQVGPFETRVTTVMGANRDGSEARLITTLLRGGVSAWLDNQRLLLSARLQRGSQEVTLFTYSLIDGSRKELAKSERLRTVSPAPGGEWIAYTIVFDKDSSHSGLWLVRTDGSTAKRLDVFGAFQWRDGHRLIYVPLDVDAASHVFYEYDANTGDHRQLVDRKAFPFKVANGDWMVSPDGNKIVFLEAKDFNLWLWTLVN